jgi:hypothetical protein
MSIEENHSLLDTSIRIKATKRLSTAWNFSDNFGTKDEHDFKSDNLKATSNTTKDEIDTERLLDSSIEAVSPAIADKEARYKAMIAHNPGDVDTVKAITPY